MHAALLCGTLFALASAAGAAPAVFAIGRLSSMAGPIFRTQPAPWPASSRSDGYTAVTETDLVPQPALCHSDGQTSATETDSYVTNSPQQQLHRTQSLDDGNLPQMIQPPSSNHTKEDEDAYAHYCDQDDEYVEDYIPFFCSILIIFLIMLIMLAMLGHFNFQSYCPGIKKDSLESICSLNRNSQYNIIQD